jgi:hypothetical protein
MKRIEFRPDPEKHHPVSKAIQEAYEELRSETEVTRSAGPMKRVDPLAAKRAQEEALAEAAAELARERANEILAKKGLPLIPAKNLNP